MPETRNSDDKPVELKLTVVDSAASDKLLQEFGKSHFELDTEQHVSTAISHELTPEARTPFKKWIASMHELMHNAPDYLGGYTFFPRENVVTTVFMFKTPRALQAWLESDGRKSKLRELKNISGLKKMTDMKMSLEPDSLNSLNLVETNFFMSTPYQNPKSKAPLNELEQVCVIWLSVLIGLSIAHFTVRPWILENIEVIWTVKYMINLTFVVPPVKFLLIPMIANLLVKIKLRTYGRPKAEADPVSALDIELAEKETVSEIPLDYNASGLGEKSTCESK